MALFRREPKKEKAELSIGKRIPLQQKHCVFCEKDLSDILEEDLKSINWNLNQEHPEVGNISFTIGQSYPVCAGCRKFIGTKQREILAFVLDGLGLAKDHIEDRIREFMKVWDEMEEGRQKLQAEIDAGRVSPEQIAMQTPDIRGEQIDPEERI